MLFNSLVFIFGFMPIALGGYYAVAASRLNGLRLPFLILISLVFYGYWAPKYILLLVLSGLLNYGCGWLIDAAGQAGWTRARGRLVAVGVACNLGALGYFKYANFFVDNLNAAFGTGITLAHIALPLAISFFTFQQISFLVDIGRGTARPGRFLPFAAFVTFFPHLIAGPIVHFRELTPQLAARPRLNRAVQNILIGLVIFGIGLAKKTILADTAALYSSPVFDGAQAGGMPAVGQAWAAAFAYTLQVYFDFSGYSDMAIGLARMFGVQMPLNFHSPLRAGSIAGLWRQWHMTLGRIVRIYVLQPIAAPLARWSATRGHGRRASHWLGVQFPTLLAMLLIGIWHGAGWNFVLFGGLHGVYMVINEAWSFRRRQRKLPPLPRWLTAPIDRGGGHVLTLLAFVVAAVPFRAASGDITLHIYTAMLGLGGEATINLATGPDAWPLGTLGLMLALLVGYLIVFVMPNTQQIMRNSEPALDWDQWEKTDTPTIGLTWAPTRTWAILGGVVFCLGVVFILRGSTEFIYFNF